MKKNKRPQAIKVRNEEWMRAKQEHLRSNVAVPHRNKSKYNRSDKSWKKEI